MIEEYYKSTEGSKQLSPHFVVKEFACKDGCDRVLIDSDLVLILEKIRTFLNRPVHVLSGYRTESYNYKVDGAKDSYHLKGRAADISVSKISMQKVAIAAAMFGAKGVIVYKNFVHIDTRDNNFIGESNG